MAITIDWGNTNVINVPQADLTFISGTLYELDTNAFRLALKDLEDDEAGMPWPRTHIHNTAVTVAGTTFARTIEILAPYSVTFEDTGSAYTVRFIGSNNNIWDAENGILNVTSQVSYVPTNSAGLIATGTSGLTATESAALLSIATDVTASLALQTGIEARDVGKHVTNPVLGKLQIVNDTALRRWEADAWEDLAETIPYRGEGLEVVGVLTEIAY